MADGQENAGTIQSFDPASGKLVIDLFGNGTIGGMVTEQTEIQCENEHSTASASDSQQGDDNPGEDEGQPGEDGGESGNDNGGNVNCTTADLMPGAVIHQAELQIENGAATFEEVELAG